MKKKISEHIQKYLTKHAGEEEKLNEFAVFIEDFFTKIPEEHTTVHNDFYIEVENFTDEIDEEMIIAIVENLRQKNGEISGEKWSLEDAKNVVKQYDVKTKIEACGKTLDCYKFWLALNYVYATHYSINRTINGYVDLAIDEYCNKNVCFDTTIRKIFEKIN
jgi:hypothetical protein